MSIKCLLQLPDLQPLLFRTCKHAPQPLLSKAMATAVLLSIIGTSHASFPPVIDVVNDSQELRNDARITVDGVWMPSRAMGDLD